MGKKTERAKRLWMLLYLCPQCETEIAEYTLDEHSDELRLRKEVISCYSCGANALVESMSNARSR